MFALFRLPPTISDRTVPDILAAELRCGESLREAALRDAGPFEIFMASRFPHCTFLNKLTICDACDAIYTTISAEVQALSAIGFTQFWITLL